MVFRAHHRRRGRRNRVPSKRAGSSVASLAAVLLTIVLAVGGSRRAVADTIYLKNGRSIDTAYARVEGDGVLFELYGAKIVIPLSEVERIEENERTGPEPRPPVKPSAGPPGQIPREDREPDPVPEPEETKEYWQDRVRAIHAEARALEADLRWLRRVERAFLFAHMSTADVRRQIEEVLERTAANQRALPELRREARRKGIPPGWLRLPRRDQRPGG